MISKTLLALSVSALLFISCKPTSSEPKAETSGITKETTAIVMQKPEKATFCVSGMTCAIGCAKTIEKELCKMNGVQQATVDFETKRASVTYDAAQQSAASLTVKVQATGDGKTYKVSEMKTVAVTE